MTDAARGGKKEPPFLWLDIKHPRLYLKAEFHTFLSWYFSLFPGEAVGPGFSFSYLRGLGIGLDFDPFGSFGSLVTSRFFIFDDFDFQPSRHSILCNLPSS